MRTLPFLLVSTLAAACGGNELDPGSGNDPGTGTMTLFINGDASATPQIPNAQHDQDFDTTFDIDVRKDNADVTTGTVTVTSKGGALQLTYDTQNNGHWRGTQSGYFEVYVLSVVSGTDKIDSVRVDGPAIHHFTAPVGGATVDATMPLVVKWDRAETADAAELDTNRIDNVAIPDTGTYTIPVGSLQSDPQETRNDRVRLDRWSRIAPGGATGGSELRVTVHNTVEFLVAPTGP